MNGDDCMPADMSPAGVSIRGTEEIPPKRSSVTGMEQPCFHRSAGFSRYKKAHEKQPMLGLKCFSRAGFPLNAGLRRNGLEAGGWLAVGCQIGQIDAGLDGYCRKFGFLLGRLTLLVRLRLGALDSGEQLYAGCQNLGRGPADDQGAQLTGQLDTVVRLGNHHLKRLDDVAPDDAAGDTQEPADLDVTGVKVQGRIDLDRHVVRRGLAILSETVVGQAHVAQIPVFPGTGEISFEINLVDHGSSPSVKWELNAKRHFVRQEMLRTNVACLANEGGYSIVAG